MPGPYTIAMANLGKVAYGAAIAEEVGKSAFMAGRQKEAKDAYDGAGYSFDITETLDMPKLEPATPPRIKTDLFATPERKRGPLGTAIDTVKAWASPDTMRAPAMLKHRPNPDSIYSSLHSAKSQIGKTFGKFEDWQQPVLDVAQRLPVGESIEVDFGPVTGPRKYHAKISRKTTT
jgi:hypothetical protein